jgi:hypothetical protein
MNKNIIIAICIVISIILSSIVAVNVYFDSHSRKIVDDRIFRMSAAIDRKDARDQVQAWIEENIRSDKRYFDWDKSHQDQKTFSVTAPFDWKVLGFTDAEPFVELMACVNNHDQLIAVLFIFGRQGIIYADDGRFDPNYTALIVHRSGNFAVFNNP